MVQGDAMVVITTSGLVCAISLLLTCREKARCLETGTCSPDGAICSFVMCSQFIDATLDSGTGPVGGWGNGTMGAAPNNLTGWPTPTEYLVPVGIVSRVGMHATGVQAVCAPGNVRRYSAVLDRYECTLRFAFPNGFIEEAGVADSLCLTERACGRWLSAVAAPSAMHGPVSWVMSQASLTASRALRINENTGHESRLAASAKDKFRARCSGLVHLGEGAILQDMRDAYQYLVSLAPRIESREGLLRAISELVRHNVYSPLYMGTAIVSGASRGGYRIMTVDGPSLPWSTARDALRLVSDGGSDGGGTGVVLTDVQEAVEMIRQHLPTPSCDDDVLLLGAQEVHRLVVAVAHGSTADPLEVATHLTDSAWRPRDEATISDYQELHSLKALLCAAADPRFYRDGLATAWYRAHAAVVSTYILGTFQVSVPPDAAGGSATRRNEESSAVHHVGRASRRVGMDLLSDEPSMAEWQQATAANGQVGLQAMRIARARATEQRSEPTAEELHRSACGILSQTFYVEDFERELYRRVVGEGTFEQRLFDMSEQLKVAVRSVVAGGLGTRGARLAAAFPEPSVALQRIDALRVRIAGAPSDTPFGAQWTGPASTIESNDGVSVLALKQLVQTTALRMTRAIDPQAHACAHDPLFDVLQVNAYHLSPWSCVVLSLGMLVYPFADPLFTQDSLLSGVGFILAHEFAHSVVGTPRDQSALAQLLSLYHPSTHEEGIADVIAALAISELAGRNFTTLAPRLTQMWCSKTPYHYPGMLAPSHPESYHRISKLCSTVASHGLSECKWDTCV